MFKQFQRTLIMNYIWGSGIAVFGVGGLFIFQTLSLSRPRCSSWPSSWGCRV
ncbi:hypothetical protein [Exiguobacterium mexicanum]|uniref:hypothetical protein n=1 Tax=Exiguobacterium mexicanum TaxID=340146 RepID=UPI0037C11FF5